MFATNINIKNFKMGKNQNGKILKEKHSFKIFYDKNFFIEYYNNNSIKSINMKRHEDNNYDKLIYFEMQINEKNEIMECIIKTTKSYYDLSERIKISGELVETIDDHFPYLEKYLEETKKIFLAKEFF